MKHLLCTCTAFSRLRFKHFVHLEISISTEFNDNFKYISNIGRVSFLESAEANELGKRQPILLIIKPIGIYSSSWKFINTYTGGTLISTRLHIPIGMFEN